MSYTIEEMKKDDMVLYLVIGIVILMFILAGLITAFT
jgi:hypothetical protein